jgi:DNA-binding SARP family transcriptional activator
MLRTSLYQTVVETEESPHAVLICVLGGFALFAADHPIQLRGAPKTEALISSLVLGPPTGVSRDSLLATLWPDAPPGPAAQSLNSLTHYLQNLLGPSLSGAPVLLHLGGSYRLNYGAGVAVDCLQFDARAAQGDRDVDIGDARAALAAYQGAERLYRGDLGIGNDVRALVERERLRAVHLRVLAWVADHYFQAGDYRQCQAFAGRLLSCEPTREDAHRLLMRCFVRLGERAQALRQFRICTEVLRMEFDTAPERETLALFEQLRNAPADI